jgi:phage anti-repressor protein
MISFIDFLKKYSTIPNQFLDDFFKLFNYKSGFSTEKTINLEDVAKWLDVHKYALKNTLEASYTKNIDYEISKVHKPTGRGGQKREIILVTIDCFKMLCQSTKSKKGKEVRRYFIEVEKLMNKYKNYIIEGLEKKINTIEKGKNPKINPQKGVIYVFKTPDTPENGLYKIGRSTAFKKRIQSHQSALSQDIDILFVQETDDVVVVEKCVKALMQKRQYRKYKEIYQVDIDIIKTAIHECEELKSKIDEMEKIDNETQNGGYKYYMMIDSI